MAPRKLSLNDYEITRDGRVINKLTNHTLSPQPNGKGYLRVSIGKKLYFVHRLVAMQYIPNPNNYEQVNHKDGDKTNNSVENLEWVTNQGNRTHAVANGLHLQGEQCSWAKLTAENVKFIREHPEISNNEYAELFGVNPKTISSVKNYKTWKYLS